MRSPLRIYNTPARAAEVFRPAYPSRVTFYTCGPTLYDDAHVGNFRAFLLADVLRRWIEHPLCVVEGSCGELHDGPREVVHVMNLTDVGHMTDDAAADGAGEDKMQAAGRRLAEAKKSGALPAGSSIDPRDPYAIAGFYAERFVEDALALGLQVVADSVSMPERLPRATGAVSSMVEAIGKLIERGHAYAVGPEGRQTVYFDVSTFPEYGKLSGNTLERLRGGAGGRVNDADQSEKRQPADFMLWKADPSHVMKWPSPWGEGYPGWHIECTAMALDLLGEGDPPTIDLHSGGEDNVFPHHECEIAQSCCLTGADVFARHWFHVRHLFVEGEKMSKSRGNFFTPRELFAQGHEPAAVRLELVRGHYRSNADFTLRGVKDAARQVERWRSFAERGEQSAEQGDEASEANQAVRDAVVEAYQNDLNVAEAIGVLNAWIARTPEPTRADAAVFRLLERPIGALDRDRLERVESTDILWLPGAAPDASIEALVAERKEAKRAKDFARADAIRDELAGLGLAIKDVAGGKVEVGPSAAPSSADR